MCFGQIFEKQTDISTTVCFCLLYLCLFHLKTNNELVKLYKIYILINSYTTITEYSQILIKKGKVWCMYCIIYIIIITFKSLSTKYQQCYVLLANIKKYFTNIKRKIFLYGEKRVFYFNIVLNFILF